MLISCDFLANFSKLNLKQYYWRIVWADKQSTEINSIFTL